MYDFFTIINGLNAPGSAKVTGTKFSWCPESRVTAYRAGKTTSETQLPPAGGCFRGSSPQSFVEEGRISVDRLIYV
jgi:hypothetical protein